ncbi:hypothetical protein ACIBHY_39735 [Nonomuraea sp. NPDC050547]|uniref:hypothetical protein n=1 Tax=unclassified Nonomuraea TaxID=2593643 RepID=UPI0037BA3767
MLCPWRGGSGRGRATGAAPCAGGQAHRETISDTYASPGLEIEPQEAVQYPYSVGEIVTAAAEAGLTVTRLGEHVAVDLDPRSLLSRGEDGLFRLPFGDSHLPMLYSLRAHLPG